MFARDPAALNRQPIPLVKSVSWIASRGRARRLSFPAAAVNAAPEFLFDRSRKFCGAPPSTRLCNGRSKPVLDRASSGPRQRRQALPHLPPKSLYIRATTGQMTASAWWLRQHSKAHHLRPHRREVNLLLPLRRYCGAHRSKSDLLSLWNNYNLRASQCRVCMPAMAIRHKALSLL